MPLLCFPTKRLLPSLVSGLVLLSAVGSQPTLLWAESLPRVAESPGPRSEDRIIAKTVKQLVEQNHISRRMFDDELSQRTFDRFLRALDPMKLYFFKSDIQEFNAERNQLDDRAKRGDIGFAYMVFKRQLERIDQIMPIVHQLIDTPYDFTLDEQVAIDRDVVDYPTDLTEAQERWRKQIKYSLLVLKADQKTDEQAREQLHRRFRTLEKNRKQMDVYELLELYLSSLTESLDPHTNYLAPRAKENFDIQLGLQLQGIGATLKSEDGITVIASTVPGGAADKDGRLKEGDRILAVGQEGNPEMVDVVDMKLDDVVSLIRGPAGTKVRLSVQPKVGNETKLLEITRAKIELKDSAARGEILNRGLKADGSPYRLGYIELPSFYFDMEGNRPGSNRRSTTEDVEAILRDFRASSVDAVILDLSKNGGGSLSEAIGCTGLFIDRGPVVQVKNSEGQSMAYEDENRGVAWDGPLIVMTSTMSASASEIFAGAIKDYDRGLVIGDPTTHGKGTVQQLYDVGQEIFGTTSAKSYGALKLTIQQFYLPDGQSTQREGVTADIELPSITANMEGLREADLDYALPADRLPQRPHQHYGLVDDTIRTSLSALSKERVARSEDFRKLQRRIDAYLKQKSEKYASLSEAQFLARRAEFDAEKEEEEQFKKQEETKNKIYDETFYNEEVMNIVVDYLQALSQRKLAKAG
jgi:carboxyl-terminal processing protease